MPTLTWIGHHRLMVLGLGLAVLITALGVGVWFFVLRSPGTQIDLRQAIRQYREGQHSSATAEYGSLPPPGVYQFRTTGEEQLSVGGITRTFPTTSRMIVTDSTCATMKWEPLEQHMEGIVACRSENGALSIASAPSYEAIAGTQTTSVIRCPAHTYLIPPNSRSGQRWQATCHSPDERVIFSAASSIRRQSTWVVR